MTEGESIAKDNVHQIVVGRTSKWDLMEWFGPPAAIIRPASHVVKIPASRSGRSMAETGGDWTQGIRHGGFYYAQPVVFLECVDRDALASHERIYYFMHSWYMQYALIALGPLEFGGTELDELVVVVNEETQKVEAFFHYDAE